MGFLLSAWLGDVQRKYKQTKPGVFWKSHCGHAKVATRNYWDYWWSHQQSYSIEEPVNINRNKTTIPPSGETNSIGMSLVWKLYENRRFSEKTTDIMLQSWQQSSQNNMTHPKVGTVLCWKEDWPHSCKYKWCATVSGWYEWSESKLQQHLLRTLCPLSHLTDSMLCYL